MENQVGRRVGRRWRRWRRVRPPRGEPERDLIFHVIEKRSSCEILVFAALAPGSPLAGKALENAAHARQKMSQLPAIEAPGQASETGESAPTTQGKDH